MILQYPDNQFSINRIVRCSAPLIVYLWKYTTNSTGLCP